MPKVVIADTSCLIVLSKINALQLLTKLYNEIIITSQVATEYNQALPEWIKIQQPSNSKIFEELKKELDLGEASSIALALESPDALIIVDDLLARKKIQELKLNFTGTLGVLVRSKKEGHITSVKPVIEALRKSTLECHQ